MIPRTKEKALFITVRTMRDVDHSLFLKKEGTKAESALLQMLVESSNAVSYQPR